MAGDKSLDSLQVWRKSMDFALRIYKEVLPLLPKEENWALANQMRRAAQSIPANIAEGYGRYYFQETIRFCYITRGSLEETYSYLVFTREVGYLPEPEFTALVKEVGDIRRILNGYIAFLKQSKRGEHEPGNHYSVKELSEEYLIDPTPELPDS
jgi:four helix bundle protein